MGKRTTTEPDLALVPATGSLTSTTAGASVSDLGPGSFNLSLWGTFSATVALERSFDGGTTFLPLSVDAYGTAIALTAPCSLVVDEPEAGVLYRVRASAYTSGTVSWRLSK